MLRDFLLTIEAWIEARPMNSYLFGFLAGAITVLIFVLVGDAHHRGEK